MTTAIRRIDKPDLTDGFVKEPHTHVRAFANTDREIAFQQRKIELLDTLLDRLNIGISGGRGNLVAENAQKLRDGIEYLIATEATDLDSELQQRMLQDLLDEVHGLGPLEPLMRDASINDILVNNPREVYIEQNGQLVRTHVLFADTQHLLRIAQRVASRVGRRVDESRPMVDARLADGSRLNVTIPPVAIDGATISIRRFPAEPFSLDQLLSKGAMCPEIRDFLLAAVQAKLSFLISGGTGTGKTTLLNALAAGVPESERIVTVEDSAELRLRHPHVVRLESRISNTEGVGEISLRELVRNALRMRPDRLLVGEVRGAEAVDMLQAINTGHEGSFSTIHANTARDSLSRLEMMVTMGGFDLPLAVIRAYIAAGIKLVVHLARWKDGSRRVMRIAELTGLADGDFHLLDIFRFDRTAEEGTANRPGRFVATGHVPTFLDRLSDVAPELVASWFSPRTLPEENCDRETMFTEVGKVMAPAGAAN